MSLKDSLRVMIVDDMSTGRGLLLQALEELQIRQVEIRKDGQIALQALIARPVHLVISDYHRPGMDGLGLLKCLRENEATRRIGFILVSGTADRSALEAGQKLGMNNYLKKPFTTEQMKTCIQAVVGDL
ncbi:MAG: response regulator [Paracoccaceae bacterium]